MPGPQGLGDAPRLGDTPSRRVGWIAVEDLGDRAEPVLPEVVSHWSEQVASTDRIVEDAPPRERQRAQQPAPDHALMVGAVALALAALVSPTVGGMIGRQAPEP